MLIVDTSAVILALSDPSHPAADAMRASSDLHAPHLLDVEFLNAVRRLVSDASLNETQAGQLLTSFAELRVERYAHAPLAVRIWELRHNLTAYDAAYVSLAEVLGFPLLTADTKLANAPGNSAEIISVRQP